MEDIISEYGTGLLALLGGGAAMAVYTLCIRDGGALHTIVQSFMQSICG